MTDFAIVEDGKLARVVRGNEPYVDRDGVQYPGNVWVLWSAEELKAKLGAIAVTPAEIPAGKRAAAPPVRVLEIDELTGAVAVREVLQLEDVPAPRFLVPRLKIVDRLIAAGLDDAAYAVLEQPANARLKRRYDAAIEIWNDDAEAIGLLNAIGADPAKILAQP